MSVSPPLHLSLLFVLGWVSSISGAAGPFDASSAGLVVGKSSAMSATCIDGRFRKVADDYVSFSTSWLAATAAAVV